MITFNKNNVWKDSFGGEPFHTEIYFFKTFLPFTM